MYSIFATGRRLKNLKKHSLQFKKKLRKSASNVSIQKNLKDHEINFQKLRQILKIECTIC